MRDIVREHNCYMIAYNFSAYSLKLCIRARYKYVLIKVSTTTPELFFFPLGESLLRIGAYEINPTVVIAAKEQMYGYCLSKTQILTTAAFEIGHAFEIEKSARVSV